jgi:hypothetical protein
MVSPLDHVSLHRSTPKSFKRLLLSLFAPVSPLGAHSYKKIGGVPPVDKDETRNTGFSLCAVSQNGTHIVKLACRPPAGQAGLGRPVLLNPIAHLFEAPRGSSPAVAGHPVDIDGTDLQCFLSLTDFPRACPQKHPNVFYHLQTQTHVTTSVFYHLQKRRGVGWRQSSSKMGISLTEALAWEP